MIIFVLTSIIQIILFRYVFLAFVWILQKLFKSDLRNKLDNGLAGKIVKQTIALTFIAIIPPIVLNTVIFATKIQEFDLFLAFTLFGVIILLWCYFDIDTHFASLPKFDSKKSIAVKKILIFSIVLCWTFKLGYTQIREIIYGLPKMPENYITNMLVTTGIIAFDRILSQMQILFEKDRDRQALPK